MNRLKQLALAVGLAVCLPLLAIGQDMTLDYVSRYICQRSEPDHLVDAVGVSGNRAIAAGNRGLALVDLDALPPQGTQDYLYRLQNLGARNVYPKDDVYLYVNLNRNGASGSGGFAVVKLVGNTLQHIRTVDQPDVLFEKMCIDGDYLYVAAHSKGIRIYSLANPEDPSLGGSLQEGFVDAWAIAVDGNTAYVADGGGGLKILDVTDRSDPVIIDGEELETAVGTCEDVAFRNGNVFVAAGGAGIAVYEGGNINNRNLFHLRGYAQDLCWSDDFLVVAKGDGFVVLEVNDPGAISVVASEITARRGSNSTLRLCSAVGCADTNLILAATWNYMDVYELKTPQTSDQPDISCTRQRIRFLPSGGTETVTVWNNGAGVLDITSISPSQSAFSVNYSGGTLPPGDSVSFEISYDGSPDGTGVVRIYCNDPDEDPLPIQVFGNTSHLDPGEPAVDFTLLSLRRDPQSGGYIEESFTLSEHLGKVVWFEVYASW